MKKKDCMKIFLLSIVFPLFLFGNVEKELNDKIDFYNKLIRDEQHLDKDDWYPFFFYVGKVEAYKECLEMIKENTKSDVLQ